MKARPATTALLWLGALLWPGLGCASGHGHHHAEARGSAPVSSRAELAVPASIAAEHRHLHHQLEAAMAAGGRTGDAAKAVADALAPHFEDEEAFAMPPLGLLGALARGEPVGDEQQRQAIAMAARLRADYDRMLAEHGRISAALGALAAAARAEGEEAHAAFAEALVQHARNEEEVLYPTTLLVGEYLELRRGPER